MRRQPLVFQRLMQQVLKGLKPESGPEFVTVYLDDIIVFSPTLEEHLDHLRLVIEKIESAGLKLKPSATSYVMKWNTLPTW